MQSILHIGGIMNLKQMSYIVTIADSQNISKAAEKLFITRPALNHFLTNLENELGFTLFERLNRRLILTEAGKIYVNSARKIISIEQERDKLLNELANCEVGEIKVGITRVIGARMFNTIFPIFHQRYPNFTVKLIEGNVNRLEKFLLNGGIDFAVTGTISKDLPLEYVSFAPCEIVIVLPLNHPLATKAKNNSGNQRCSLDLKELKNDAFILMSPETKLRTICTQRFNEAEFSPKIMLETGLSSTAFELVKNGVAPTILMETSITEKDKVAIFSLNPKEYWHQSIAYRKGCIFSKAEKYFIELAKDYFEKL